MTSRIEFGMDPDGVRITKLSSVDATIVVPEDVNGYPVVAIGPSFLSGSVGRGSRTLVIPGCVKRIDPHMLDGIAGVSRIEYQGELSDFEKCKVMTNCDCVLKCKADGEDFEFRFINGHPMSFPEFDDIILSLCMRLTPEIALKRLTHPIGLTEENRIKYEKFVSDRVMPKAEQAVTNGDVETLKSLFASGMIHEGDMRKLLERSVISGRIPVTSLLMSRIREMSLEQEGRV